MPMIAQVTRRRHASGHTSVGMPTGRYRFCWGKPSPPSLLLHCPLLSTYPSLDRVISSSKTTAVEVVEADDYKVLGDSHDSTLLHHQGLGAGLENALGADSGL